MYTLIKLNLFNEYEVILEAAKPFAETKTFTL